MTILLILIPLSLLLVGCGAWAFFWAVDTDQFDDLESRGWDVLTDDDCTIARQSSLAKMLDDR